MTQRERERERERERDSFCALERKKLYPTVRATHTLITFTLITGCNYVDMVTQCASYLIFISTFKLEYDALYCQVKSKTILFQFLCACGCADVCACMSLFRNARGHCMQ